MLDEHDQDVLPRCPRLGHELIFGYCRRETGGRPCRLILDCWWERFDVRTFLQANLPAETMTQVEDSSAASPSMQSAEPGGDDPAGERRIASGNPEKKEVDSQVATVDRRRRLSHSATDHRGADRVKTAGRSDFKGGISSFDR